MQISEVTLGNYINQPNRVSWRERHVKSQMNGQWATYSVARGQGKRGKMVENEKSVEEREKTWARLYYLF